VLYLNIFRGKPAITELDKLFTSTHRSSQSLSTDTGSALHIPVKYFFINNLISYISLSIGSSHGFGSNGENLSLFLQ